MNNQQGEVTMCQAKKSRVVVECEICGHQLSDVEQEGVMMLSPLQAKLMAQVISECSELTVIEIVKRWNDMGLVNNQCFALSF